MKSITFFKINTVWDMADFIPYKFPTQFQDSIFPPITRPKIPAQNTPITPSTPPPPFPISQATTAHCTV
jgi:hypothetical protein